MSVTATTRLKVNVRRGPAKGAGYLRTLQPGVRLEALEIVNGESVSSENRWLRLSGDEFVWLGGCDLKAGGEGPDRPDADADRPGRRVLGDRTPPRLQTATGIRHKAQGRRPNGLEGAIVHFDAYRIRRAGNGAEDSDARTLDMLRSGQANGYHYAEISRTGTIFLPEGFSWDEWGYHAGKSVCPVTRRTGVSQFYVGFEMNNPGVLYPAQERDVFCPWFNSLRDANGNVILDSRGRCTRRSATDEWYGRGEVREAAGGNIKKAWYLPYSHDQFEALVNVMLWLAGRFSSFSLDRVLGHDEVAPTRKWDPGGALATPDEVMTMPQFRDLLRSRL